MRRKFISIIICILLSTVIGFAAAAESKALFPDNGKPRPVILRQADPYMIDLDMSRTDYANYRYSLSTDINQDASYSYETRSPLAAFVVGFAPGFIIHGLGHAYIGDHKTASWLLLSECAAVFLSFESAREAMGKYHGASNKMSNFMGYAGLVIFAGGWIIDFIHAPIQLANKQAIMAQRRALLFDIQKRNVILKYSVAF